MRTIDSIPVRKSNDRFADSKVFTLVLAMISMMMIFAGFTSAYLVSKGSGPWINVDLPTAFTVSTIVIVLSSISMQWAYFAAQKNQIKLLQILMGVSCLLGAAFLWSQLEAYKALVANDFYLVGNQASSYLYVISGTHAAHLIGGLVFLIVTFISALRYKIHSKSMQRIFMCTIFWHFLGGLWVFLYFFFQLNA